MLRNNNTYKKCSGRTDCFLFLIIFSGVFAQAAETPEDFLSQKLPTISENNPQKGILENMLTGAIEHSLKKMKINLDNPSITLPDSHIHIHNPHLTMEIDAQLFAKTLIENVYQKFQFFNSYAFYKHLILLQLAFIIGSWIPRIVIKKIIRKSSHRPSGKTITQS